MTVDPKDGGCVWMIVQDYAQSKVLPFKTFFSS